jgi:hypothetical protein
MSVELGLEIRARTDSAQRSQLFMNLVPIHCVTYFIMKHLPANSMELKSCYALRYFRNFQSLMELELIIMFTRISSYSTHPHHTALRFTFNIILLLTATCPKWSLCFSIQTKILHPFLTLATCPAYLMIPLFGRLNTIQKKYKL